MIIHALKKTDWEKATREGIYRCDSLPKELKNIK